MKNETKLSNTSLLFLGCDPGQRELQSEQGDHGVLPVQPAGQAQHTQRGAQAGHQNRAPLDLITLF